MKKRRKMQSNRYLMTGKPTQTERCRDRGIQGKTCGRGEEADGHQTREAPAKRVKIKIPELFLDVGL
jgi:hypothetical protein